MTREKMSYWNEEYNDVIICPYCEEKYELSEETYIGHKLVDLHAENRQELVCDKCGKKFAMYGFKTGLCGEWEYITATIDGQMTLEEAEEILQKKTESEE